MSEIEWDFLRLRLVEKHFVIKRVQSNYANSFKPRSPQPRLNPKERVLADWRRIDLTSEERAQKDSAKRIQNVMPGVLQQLGLDQRRSQLEILKVWNHAIDPNIVRHAQPTGLHKGTLFVTCDSNVWLSEIVRYRMKEILTRLRHSFGPDLILRISVRVG